MIGTLEERFWAKVDKCSPQKCWPWKGGKSSKGYGLIWREGRLKVASVISWEIENKQQFPNGRDACHTCDNPSCVNPHHIWPGTAKENADDCVRKGRHNYGVAALRENVLKQKAQTHCKRGHPFSGNNLGFQNQGKGRLCLNCKAETDRRHNQRRREIRRLLATLTKETGT